MIAGWFRSTCEAINISFLCSPGKLEIVGVISPPKPIILLWGMIRLHKLPNKRHLQSDYCKMSGASRAFFFPDPAMKGGRHKKGDVDFRLFRGEHFLLHLKIHMP